MFQIAVLWIWIPTQKQEVSTLKWFLALLSVPVGENEIWYMQHCPYPSLDRRMEEWAEVHCILWASLESHISAISESISTI